MKLPAIKEPSSVSTTPTPITVAQLNRQAKFLLEQHFATIWVTGEISNLSQPRSGHVYFTLKDAAAQVRCALFRQAALRCKTPLAEGQSVLLQGRVSLYEGRGDYQLIVAQVMPAGEGALQIEFAARKAKLLAEGIFADTHKQPIPKLIRTLGVVTSNTGAALQDVLQVLKRRDPRMEIWVYDCQVQGDRAAADIRRALHRAQQDATVDAILLTRGGGSTEDLWCFNDEALVRDIAACKLPIISAVGHETDTTLADYAADVRAPTPSAGAELISIDQSVLRQQLAQQLNRLKSGLSRSIKQSQQRFEYARQRLRHPQDRIREQQQRLDELSLRFERAWQRDWVAKQQRLKQLDTRLKSHSPQQRHAQALALLTQQHQRLQISIRRQLQWTAKQLAQQAQALQLASPLATLARGYAIVLDPEQQVMRSIDQLKVGQAVQTRLHNGQFTSIVQTIEVNNDSTAS
jgi:exodeoxyribonuclease VII large subunit